MEALDVTTISSIVSSVGFPIIACVALFYLYDKTLSKLTSTLEKIDTTLDKLCERINKVEAKLELKD